MPAALAFYQIAMTPTSLSSLPAAAAAAVLHARHGADPAALRAHLPPEALALHSSTGTLLAWDGAGIFITDSAIFSATPTGPVPIAALGPLDLTDGERAWVSATAPGVLAVRPADALEEAGMVRLDDLVTGAVLDMRYTTADNFTGVQLYPTGTGCYLLPETAAALIAAGHRLREVDRALLIYDCYRPLSVQEKMWAVFPRPGYVARPSATGSVHNRGGAVDVGLVDLAGQPVPLPTDHDDFTPAAAASSPDHPPEVIHNRTLLQEAMQAEGFTTIRSEWWHFNGPRAARLAMDLPFP